MNAEKCLQILREVKDVAFATVDENCVPHNRIIDIMLIEDNKIYFCTARGKDFYRQLINNNNVAVTCMNKDYQMVRVIGKAHKLDNQKMWIDRIFKENPSMKGVYPNDSRYILEPFCIDNGNMEFFDLSKEPIYRENFTLGDVPPIKKGFKITENCIHCGKCERICPQQCISDFNINDSHCLHCGLCFEQCPINAIKRICN